MKIQAAYEVGWSTSGAYDDSGRDFVLEDESWETLLDARVALEAEVATDVENGDTVV